MIDQRGRLLMAALGFAGCSMPSYDRALWAPRTWLDSWSGIGHVTGGMARQGCDLQFTRYYEWISLTCVASRCSPDEAEDDPE